MAGFLPVLLGAILLSERGARVRHFIRACNIGLCENFFFLLNAKLLRRYVSILCLYIDMYVYNKTKF